MAKVSIKQIAEMTKLSPGTISLVLNGRGDEMRIAKKTQQRVMDTAREIGYLPNIYARRLRSNKGDQQSIIIGVLWPSRYSADLLVRFFAGIQNSILNNKLNVEVIFKPYVYTALDQVNDLFTSGLFSGVIIVGAANKDIEYLHTVETTMPIVFFNRHDSRYCAVGPDDFAAGEQIADLFYQRGHKTIALIESDYPARHYSMRKTGFITYLQQKDISILPEHIAAAPFESIREASEKILSTKKKPTALYVMQSHAIQDLYTVCKDKHIKIPDDLEVLAHGDISINSILSPSLSVLDLPLEEMVNRCLLLIIDMLRGKINQPLNILVNNKFIFRESCGGFPK